MNRHAIIPAAALAGALAAAATIAGCTSSTTVNSSPPARQTTNAAHGAPMILATEAAPGYLSGSTAPRLPSSGTLKLLASLKSGVSIPWGLVSRDESTGAVTVDVDDGGCVSAPFGYTASTSLAASASVEITIYSTSLLKGNEVCAGVGHIQSFTLTLPPADAKLALLHAVSQ